MCIRDSAQAVSTQADASGAARDYAISPGPLNDTLAAFARQAGISLAYSSAQLQGARSAGLNGRFGVADGLRTLLAGTGYRAVNVDGGIRVEAEMCIRDRPLTCCLITRHVSSMRQLDAVTKTVRTSSWVSNAP